MSLVWIDGRLVDKNDARISVFDHGFLYGDGVWEGLRAYAGTPFRLRDHLANLARSADTIGLRVPLTADELAAAVGQTLTANNRTDGYVRIIVTRGPGTLGLDPRKCAPTVIVIAEEIGLYPRELADHGLDVVTLEGRVSLWWGRPPCRPEAQAGTEAGPTKLPRPFPPGTLLSRAAFVAAKATALRAGCFEALLFDPTGVLIGATEATAFAVVEGKLLPGTDDSDAVMRGVVLELAGMPVSNRPANRSDMAGADEVFLAGSAGGLIAVAKIDGRPVGPGGEGPMTRRLREQLRSLTTSTDAGSSLVR